MEKMEAKFCILLDCNCYRQSFTNDSITTALHWARCTGHFHTFRRPWYDIKDCNECLKQPFWNSKRNVAFERHEFCLATPEPNKKSMNFVTKLQKLASTGEFSNQNAEIQKYFIDKCSCNCLCHYLLQ